MHDFFIFTPEYTILALSFGPLLHPLLDLGQLEDFVVHVGHLGRGSLPLIRESLAAKLNRGDEDKIGNSNLQ